MHNTHLMTCSFFMVSRTSPRSPPPSRGDTTPHVGRSNSSNSIVQATRNTAAEATGLCTAQDDNGYGQMAERSQDLSGPLNCAWH